MNIIKLTDSVAVSAQILPEDVAAIAAAGYKVLINNRPDGEEANQPAGADIAAAAQAAGLDYYHMPMTSANFPGVDLDLMSSLLDNADEPVLAFCRSGTRCTNLWVATRSEEASEDAVGAARALGFDLAMSLR